MPFEITSGIPPGLQLQFWKGGSLPRVLWHTSPWVDGLDTRSMGSSYCWLVFIECPICTCISTVVHILLKSASAFSVGPLGLHIPEKENQSFRKVWVLMHMLLRHIQQLPLDPCWNDFHDRRKKKCPGLKELMWIMTYEVAPKASCSQIFQVTLTKKIRERA